MSCGSHRVKKLRKANGCLILPGPLRRVLTVEWLSHLNTHNDRYCLYTSINPLSTIPWQTPRWAANMYENMTTFPHLYIPSNNSFRDFLYNSKIRGEKQE